MSSLCGSLDKKIVWGNWNFNMAAIFQDGQHLSAAFKYYNSLFGDTSKKIGMSSLYGSLDKKIVWGNWNFNVAAIFQDGRHLSAAVK